MSKTREDFSKANMSEHTPSEVIYQIYPASFFDSNSDGHGDLQGIIEKLGYIKTLGVDSIWISPFFLSPSGPEGDGGYAVTDYRAVDPKFGTMQDFKDLLNKAHENGLRVYTDFVLAHTAKDHDWFKKSRNREESYEDHYVWHDGKYDENGNNIPPNNWKSVFGGRAWSWDDTREQWYMHHFMPSQPALNNNLEKVQDKVLAEMKFWLDMGVDGFRLDALPFTNYDSDFRDNPWLDGQWPRDDERWDDQYFAHSICQPQTIEFIKRIKGLMDSYPNKKTTLGEAISGPEGGRNSVPVAASYVCENNGLDMCYTEALMSIREYPDQPRVKGMIEYIESHFPKGGNCNAASNHDIPRSGSRMTNHMSEEHKDKINRQLITLFVTLPGSFCMYQGEELGLEDASIPDDIPLDKIKDAVAWSKGLEHCRDGARTPMPWESGQNHTGFTSSDDPYLPVPQKHIDNAVDMQEKDPNSILNFTRKLITWRKNQPALIKGWTETLNTPAPVLAFLRKSKEQTMLCLYNMGEQEHRFKPADHLSEEEMKELGYNTDTVITLDAFDSVMKDINPPVERPSEAKNQLVL